MDTRTKTPEQVAQDLQRIKTQMPETYKAIQAEVSVAGNEVYALVRRGLRGEPNCFWAMEAGHIVGTPFDQTDIQSDVAWNMVGFGCAYACIFQDIHRGPNRGTH